MAAKKKTPGFQPVKPSHRGLFTKKAHAAGKSVAEYAKEEAHAPGKLGKEARFARLAEEGKMGAKKHSHGKKPKSHKK